VDEQANKGKCTNNHALDEEETTQAGLKPATLGLAG
jgi:hypothetical protein